MQTTNTEKGKSDISTSDFAELICQAIRDEPYFTKEVLIPKIRSLATAFRLRLSSINYSKSLSPTKTEHLIRANEIMNMKINFWKSKLKEIVGNENMSNYYEELKTKESEWIQTAPTN